MTRRTLVPGGLDPLLTVFLDTVAKKSDAVADLSGTASDTSTAPGSAVSSSAISSVATTGSTNSSPYGYTTAAQADAIVTALNDVITRQALIITLVNEIRATVVALRTDMAANADLIDTMTSKVNETLAALRAAGKMDAS